MAEGNFYLDAEPLLRLIDSRGLVYGSDKRARALRTLYRAVLRARDTGRVTMTMGDQLCVALLGEHPSYVWGDVWWELDRARAAFLSLYDWQARHQGAMA